MENSSLNKLSAELRNEIYELVLAQDKPLVICSEHPNPDSTAIQPPLTRVCRQIRAEALELFYYCNTFVIEMISSRLWDWDDYILWNFPYEPEYETWGEYDMPVPCSQREILERRTYEASEWLECTSQKHHDIIKKVKVMVSTYADDWDHYEEEHVGTYNIKTLVKKLRECGYGGIEGQQKLKVTVHLVSEYTTDDELLWVYGGSADERCMEMKTNARKFFEEQGLEVEVTWKKMWSHDVSNCSHCRAPLQEPQ
ncbi:hypothetical protein CKM354_001018900 [Cercospora kikuchii]|uniref:Uncharacterized protein n=1 Tax=Cercospora kikuchii TaxID=84275 RepID=A0A9P3FGW5_9PEZI|nr:uncharacterized protein CKM354_001018900 [Cercospora kikuchii]GIZ47088.1 hypothetical protein CKM354_001018900 [Cercospora kikuchii]